MACLDRIYHLKLFKGCLPQVLLGPFLNNVTYMYCSLDNTIDDYCFPRNISGTTVTYLDQKIFNWFFRDEVKSFLSPLFAKNRFRFDQGNCPWRVNLIFVINISIKQRRSIKTVFHRNYSLRCIEKTFIYLEEKVTSPTKKIGETRETLYAA